MAFEYRLNSGNSTARTIDFLGDKDSFATTLINGLTYSAKVSGSYSGGGTLADPNLTLTNAAGQRLLFNDDIRPGVNRDAQLTFTVNSSGNYGLIVGEQGDNATGSYRLALSAGYASNGNDVVTGTGYDDAIVGMAGDDRINGGGGADRLFGSAGDDLLLGGAGNDLLEGQAGRDHLRGGDQNDRLIGGSAADRLVGGTGADTFVFNSITDSSRNATDIISGGDGARAMEGVGVKGGDVIDLSGIDANENLAGNQAFAWSSAGTAGTLYLSERNGNTLLIGHTDNDGIVDFRLSIDDGTILATQYSSDEFIL